MPLTKSAIKRSKQTLVRQERLRPFKTRMKTIMRKVSDAVAAGKKDEAAKMLPEAYKVIDTAAKKNIIHRRNADRKKSGLARMVGAK
jgi:small subunit ribosomal protein S20